MSDHPLTPEAVEAALADLPGWTRDGESITKTFVFADFRSAIAFMVQVAFEADHLDHHPEWTNVYNRVEVRLVTHHVGNQVTGKDLALAAAIERVAEQ